MNKNDLLNYINLGTTEFVDKLPGYLTVKDVQSKFLLLNKNNANLVGLTCEDAIDKTDYDIKCEAVKYADDFVKQDQLTIKHNNMKYLGYFSYANNAWKIMLGEKCVIKNEKDQPIGITSYMTDVTNCKLFDIARFMIKHDDKNHRIITQDQFCYIFNDNYLESNLTQRQSECLFFLLRGYSYKSIAKILNLSPRTIEIYVESIKNRLDCCSKSQLIEKAVELGYMNILPESLIKILLESGNF